MSPSLRKLIAIAAVSALLQPAVASVRHSDLFTTSDVGIRIHLREVRGDAEPHCEAILLVHGARVGGVASFDLPVPGGSLAADLARHGLCAYAVDIRGYGRSTRPEAMEQPPHAHLPIVRSVEAVRDIDAAVDFIRERTGAGRISLFGWATGGQWAGYYASLHPEKLSHLILLNALYGGDAPQPVVGHGSDLEDPQHPGRLDPTLGAYRCNSAESLIRAWNHSIPQEDKDSWRDPAVADAYVREALASDPQSSKQNPPCFRSPNGALEDSFYLATGHRLWDASFIYIPTLVMTAQRDFWSRPTDRETLEQELVHAPAVRVVVIPNATHFVHLDRPGHGRERLLDELFDFILGHRPPRTNESRRGGM